MMNEKIEKDERAEKKPYETPTLTKLGSVEQVTQGVPLLPLPDVGGLSG